MTDQQEKSWDQQCREAEAAADAARARRLEAPTEPKLPAQVDAAETIQLASRLMDRRAPVPAQTVDEIQAAREKRILAVIPAGYAGCRLPEDGIKQVDVVRSELFGRVTRKQAIRETLEALGGAGLVWTGPSGSGKTSLACAALRRALETPGPRPVIRVRAPELALAARRYPLGDGRPTLVDHAIAAPLLLLDDLGNEDGGEAGPIQEVLAERYDHARVTWITTGSVQGDPRGARAWDGLAGRYGAHTIRRIVQRSVLIQCG